MNTHADKTSENNRQAVANSLPKLQSSGKSIFQFVDDRPEAIAQRRLQEMANNDSLVKQLKALQEMVNMPNIGITQRMMEESKEDKESPVSFPDYLYHATTKNNAKKIAEGGLEARSVGGSEKPYLCMSGILEGAVTLDGQASDIIFRVAKSKLETSEWTKSGSGKEEWRSGKGLAGDKLEYRRNLGSKDQKTWRPTSDKKHLLNNNKQSFKKIVK